MIPDIPKEKDLKINVIRTQLPGIVTFKEQVQIKELIKLTIPNIEKNLIEVKLKFDIEVNYISKSAKEKIEKMGGKVLLLNK